MPDLHLEMPKSLQTNSNERAKTRWFKLVREKLDRTIDLLFNHSFWGFPIMVMLGNVILAAGLCSIELASDRKEGLREENCGIPVLCSILFVGSPTAAENLVTLVSSAAISIATLTFSLTVLSIQLAAVNYTPRILDEFLKDPMAKRSLAVNLGAYVYCYIVSMNIQDESDRFEFRVPVVAVNMILLHLILVLTMFVFFIQYFVDSLRLESMLHKASRSARNATWHVVQQGETEAKEDTALYKLPQVPPHAFCIQAETSGYVSRYTFYRLIEIATELDFVVRFHPHIGQFVTQETLLAWVWSKDDIIDEIDNNEDEEENNDEGASMNEDEDEGEGMNEDENETHAGTEKARSSRESTHKIESTTSRETITSQRTQSMDSASNGEKRRKSKKKDSEKEGKAPKKQGSSRQTRKTDQVTEEARKKTSHGFPNMEKQMRRRKGSSRKNSRDLARRVREKFGDKKDKERERKEREKPAPRDSKHKQDKNDVDDETSISSLLGPIINRGIQLSMTRSRENDISLGVQQLSDIATRALSPGVNDPQTAVQVLDSLSVVFVKLARGNLPIPSCRDDDGHVRVVGPVRSFEFLLSVAMDHIRLYGKQDPAVVRRGLRVLGDIGFVCSRAGRMDRLKSVEQHIDAWLIVAGDSFINGSPELVSIANVHTYIKREIKGARDDTVGEDENTNDKSNDPENLAVNAQLSSDSDSSSQSSVDEEDYNSDSDSDNGNLNEGTKADEEDEAKKTREEKELEKKSSEREHQRRKEAKNQVENSGDV
mmetsp:Transcript_1680/g.3298  ORF Transcript_1680/g.3298 Transcript_1680/m.3298 type:complete len:770 (-) Transcript_1680:1325-3634(-)